MKSLPESERPYEKCLKRGPEVLSDGELLSVILRTGSVGMSSLAMCNELLQVLGDSAYPGLTGLIHIPTEDLMKIRGIGSVKAVQLKCIGELSRRISREQIRPHVSFTSPASIAGYLMEKLRHEEQEVFVALILDTKNQLLKELEITRGTVNATLITPREVFIQALKYHGVNLILAHNHPSGDPTPSLQDRTVTEQFIRSGAMLGVQVLDHIIIGDKVYYSFEEEGLIEKSLLT